MNHKIKYSIIMFIFLFLFTLLNVAISYSFDDNITANNYSLTLDCPKVVNIDEKVECELNLSGDNIGAFEANLEYSGLEFLDIEKNSLWDYVQINNNKISAFTKTDFQNATTLGSVKFKVLESKEERNIKLSNIMIFNETQSVEINNYTKGLRLISDNVYLDDLSIEGTKIIPAFSPDVMEYYVTVEKEEINLVATAPQYGSVTGTGIKKLNYGLNEFDIIVTSESGLTKSYKIYVTRLDNRSEDCNLITVTLSSGNIEFNKDKLIYDIKMDSYASIFNIEGAVDDPKSTISYPNGQSLELEYGETKQLIITVTSEKGNQKNYVFNVFREDNRSNNANLKALEVSNYNINYNNEKLNYKLEVENSVSSIEINGVAEDIKSQIVGLGTKKLNVGINTFNIAVTSEKGNTKNYTITIKRKFASQVNILSDNNLIKQLLINDQEVLIHDEIYKFNVDTYTENINISCIPEDKKAIVKVEGPDKLIIGDNEFKIIITSESGIEKIYSLIVNRAQEIINEENLIDAIKYSENQDIAISVKEGNLIFTKEILEKLSSVDKTLTYNVVDNKNAIMYSFSINSKDIKNFEDTTFQINKKSIINDVREKSVSINVSSDKNTIDKYLLKLNVNNLLNEQENINLYKYNKESNKYDNLSGIIAFNDDFIVVESSDLSEFVLTNYGDELLALKNILMYVCIIEFIILIIIVGISIIKNIKLRKRYGY